MEYNAAVGAGQTLKLKVFRYLHGSIYLVVAHDGPRSLTPGVINTFEVSIPVQAGDVIGLNDQNASTAKTPVSSKGRPGIRSWRRGATPTMALRWTRSTS